MHSTLSPTHVHIRTYTQYTHTHSQSLENVAVEDKNQNEPIFKAIEFAPTLTEGEG